MERRHGLIVTLMRLDGWLGGCTRPTKVKLEFNLISHSSCFSFLLLSFTRTACRPEELHRMRVEHMERQLANLTGLVQKALIHNPHMGPPGAGGGGGPNQNFAPSNGGSNQGTLRSGKP